MYFRSVMNNDPLNALAILNIDGELTSSINYDKLVKGFGELNRSWHSIGCCFLPRGEKFLYKALTIIYAFSFSRLINTGVSQEDLVKNWGTA